MDRVLATGDGTLSGAQKQMIELTKLEYLKQINRMQGSAATGMAGAPNLFAA